MSSHSEGQWIPPGVYMELKKPLGLCFLSEQKCGSVHVMKAKHAVNCPVWTSLSGYGSEGLRFWPSG